MEYIGVVQGITTDYRDTEFREEIVTGYLFTNRLSGLSKDDIVYHYDKKGKRIVCPHCYGEGGYIDRSGDGIDCEYCNLDGEFNQWNEILQKTFIYQGTGRILSKHRVVEVWDLSSAKYPQKVRLITGLSSVTLIARGFKWQNYIIKLEKIKDVDLELSDFVSWRLSNMKTCKDRQNNVCADSSYYSTMQGCGCYGDYKIKGFLPIEEQYADLMVCCTNKKLPKSCKLTKYTGLCKVILIGDE